MNVSTMNNRSKGTSNNQLISAFLSCSYDLHHRTRDKTRTYIMQVLIAVIPGRSLSSKGRCSCQRWEGLQHLTNGFVPVEQASFLLTSLSTTIPDYLTKLISNTCTCPYVHPRYANCTSTTHDQRMLRVSTMRDLRKWKECYIEQS